jgi:hypothetical protein
MELSRTQWFPSGGWSRELPQWDSDRTLVMVYGSSGMLDDSEPIEQVASAFPHSAVVGCSTAGEIMDETVSDESLVVAVARFDQTRLSLVHECVPASSESYQAGRGLAKQLPGSLDLDAIFVLSDGLGVNGSALVSGLVEGTEGRVVVSGGLAGDGSRFERTWVLVDGKPVDRHVTAVGFSGASLRVGHGSRGGWDIFGPERMVTRSEGNVLFELDGTPALELYRKYLGERAAGLPATALLFPLAVRVPESEESQLVRTVLAIDEDSQSMTFAGDVPEGSMAQLMCANFDRIVDAAAAAATQAGIPSDGTTLAVAVSCVGRRLLLGQRTEEELEATLSGLPEGSQLVGFYSYGELSPSASGSCDLHNQTMTITTFGESPPAGG